MIWNSTFYHDLLENIQDGVYFVDRNRVVTHWNRGAERLSGLTVESALGHACGPGLLGHVDCRGTALCGQRCPLTLAMTSGQPCAERMWLRHAEGQRVAVRARVVPIRAHAEGPVIGAAQVFVQDPPAGIRHLEQLAGAGTTDPLTGLGTEQYLASQLDQYQREWLSTGQLFGVLLTRIDDTACRGVSPDSSAPDRLLVVAARTLASSLPDSAIAARHGAQEFAVVMTTPGVEDLTVVARQLVAMVAASQVLANGRWRPLRAHLGGTLITEGDDQEAILRRASTFLIAAQCGEHGAVLVDPEARALKGRSSTTRP